jgi:hypothetical protein
MVPESTSRAAHHPLRTIVSIELVTLVFAVALLSSGSVMILSLLLCFLGMLPVVQAVYQNQWDWCEPIYAYTLLYVLGYGVRTIYLLYLDPVTGLPEFDLSHPLASEAIFVAILGLIMFHLGYLVNLGQRIGLSLPAVSAKNVSGPVVQFAIVMLFLLSLAGKLFLLATGKILAYVSTQFTTEAWENPVGYAATFGIIPYALALLYQFKTGKTFLFFWLVILPIEALFWILRGGRSGWMFLFLIALFLYHYCARPLKLSRLALMVAGIFLLLIAIYPLHSTYRNAFQFRDLQMASFFSDIREGSGRITEQRQALPDDQTGLLFGTRLIIEKFNGVEVIAKVIHGVDRMGHTWGSTLLWIPAVFIPQLLWPSKYDVLGQSADIGGRLLFGQFLGFGISLGHLSEFYLNFGLVGVAAGMLLTGILLRAVHVYCLRETLCGFGTVIFATSWGSLVFSQGSWLFEAYGNGIRLMGLTLIALWIMKIASPNAAVSPASLGEPKR